MDAAVRRFGRQAIPWMDQPAQPVGSGFCRQSPEAAFDALKLEELAGVVIEGGG